MGASRPAAVSPKWSSTTARMPLSTQRSVSSALILCSFSPTVSGVDSSGSSAASSAGAAGVSAADASPGAAFAAASASWAASAGAASGAETGASGSSSRPTSAASSSPSPKKRKGWVGSGLRVRSSAKTIFGRAAQAFSSASNAAVSTPSTSCGAGVSAAGRAGFGAGKSRALSSCISACSFCSCGVSGPRT